MSNCAFLGLVLLVAVVPATVGETAPPPVFQELDLDAARDRSVAEGKLLILDAMTSWCGPCKVMDRTTWVDETLVAWIEEHAIAVQLDMDVHERVKSGLGINAFPTIVVFKDGREFDRVVGLRDAAGMLAWLGGVRENRTSLDRARARLGELEGDAAEVLAERLELAGELLAYGARQEATAELVELWRIIPAKAPKLQEQRLTQLRGWLQTLAALHPPARSAVESLRAELVDAVGAGQDLALIRDWIELNSALGDDSATAAWATSVADSDAGVAHLRALERRIFPVLIEHGQWRAAGLALVDPVARVRAMGENLGAYDDFGRDDPGESSSTAPRRAVPMIPMGQPPAKPAKGAPATDEPAKDEPTKPKTMPAIPLGGMRPATPEPSTPTQPDDKPRMMPAIPLLKPTAPRDQTREQSREAIAGDIRLRLTHQLRGTASDFHAALLAADRGAEADAVARTLLEYADDALSRAALVAKVLRAGQLTARRQQCQGWLDEAWR